MTVTLFTTEMKHLLLMANCRTPFITAMSKKIEKDYLSGGTFRCA